MLYLIMHSKHFIHIVMAPDIWLSGIMKKGKLLPLYGIFLMRHARLDGVCYTSCGALTGTRNSSMGPSRELIQQLPEP